MNVRRFALIGKTGSGKSEVAKFLQTHFSCQIIKTGQICREISRLLFGNEDKSSTQLLDDALTKIDSSIFLRASLRAVNLEASFVIDSLRFLSDLAIAQQLECSTIRVIAEEATRIARLKARGQVFDPLKDGMHRSETELDTYQVTVTVNNDGGLDQLCSNLMRALSSYK